MSEIQDSILPAGFGLDKFGIIIHEQYAVPRPTSASNTRLRAHRARNPLEGGRVVLARSMAPGGRRGQGKHAFWSLLTSLLGQGVLLGVVVTVGSPWLVSG